MCGRYALYCDTQQLALYFGTEVPAELQPNYNVSPSQAVPIIRQDGRVGTVCWPAGAWCRSGPRT